MNRLISDGISLRGLEVFAELGRTGSIQQTASNLGLSAPAASQQLKKLEAALGRQLVEHQHRPLTLTPCGRSYLAHVEQALAALRQGAAELMLDELGAISSLRIGIIDDLDGDVTPALVKALARVLKHTDLILQTVRSLDMQEAILAREIDIGVAAGPQERQAGLIECPVLRDPFVLVTPARFIAGNTAVMPLLDTLPFIRYESGLLLARQVAAQLARLGLSPAGSIELDSNQAVFELIADGQGWTLSTLLGCLRARRQPDEVEIHPTPFPAFSRTVSLYWREDWPATLAMTVASNLRAILGSRVIEPGRKAAPWLETLEIIDEAIDEITGE